MVKAVAEHVHEGLSQLIKDAFVELGFCALGDKIDFLPFLGEVVDHPVEAAE